MNETESTDNLIEINRFRQKFLLMLSDEFKEKTAYEKFYIGINIWKALIIFKNDLENILNTDIKESLDIDVNP